MLGIRAVAEVGELWSLLYLWPVAVVVIQMARAEYIEGSGFEIEYIRSLFGLRRLLCLKSKSSPLARGCTKSLTLKLSAVDWSTCWTHPKANGL